MKKREGWGQCVLLCTATESTEALPGCLYRAAVHNRVMVQPSIAISNRVSIDINKNIGIDIINI